MRISIPGALIVEPERALRIENEILEKVGGDSRCEVSGGWRAKCRWKVFDSDWDCIFAQDKTYPDKRDGTAVSVQNIFLPGFLQTAGTRLLAGREFTWERRIRTATGSD